MNYAKTQFLMENGKLRKFKRKTATMLTQAGQPVRLISWDDWEKLKADWPKEVAADKLSVTTIWSLVEVE